MKERIESLWNAQLTYGRVVRVERMREGVYDGGKITEPVPECVRITVRATEKGRSPGAPDTFPEAVGNAFFQLWLPVANWNGVFIGLGNGGAAGHVSDGFGVNGVRAGYAVAQSDLGTSPSWHSGVGNPEVWEDFGHRATHGMTVASKELIALFYGKAPEFSYFHGGSTGGQQAVSEATRYPEDYDGIVGEVPAHSRTRLHALFLWAYQQWFRKDGSRRFSDEDYAVFVQAANEVCTADGPDYAKGRFLVDPTYRPETCEAVVARAKELRPALTDEQCDAFRKLSEGPKDPVTGEAIYGGVPFGSFPHFGNLYLFNWVFGKDYDYQSFDFHDDYRTYYDTLHAAVDAEDPDFTAFARHGGKLLLTSGTADPIVPFHGTVELLRKWAAKEGGAEEMESTVRYFLLPGKDHGGGGPGIKGWDDLVKMVRAWREKGKAPESLHAWYLDADGSRRELDVPRWKDR